MEPMLFMKCSSTMKRNWWNLNIWMNARIIIFWIKTEKQHPWQLAVPYRVLCSCVEYTKFAAGRRTHRDMFRAHVKDVRSANNNNRELLSLCVVHSCGMIAKLSSDGKQIPWRERSVSASKWSVAPSPKTPYFACIRNKTIIQITHNLLVIWLNEPLNIPLKCC